MNTRSFVPLPLPPCSAAQFHYPLTLALGTLFYVSAEVPVVVPQFGAISAEIRRRSESWSHKAKQATFTGAHVNNQDQVESHVGHVDSTHND